MSPIHNVALVVSAVFDWKP